MSEQLFIRTRGRIQGPLTLDQIQNLVRRGQFGRLHEVSEDGIQWVRASNYPHLFVKVAVAESGGAAIAERASSPGAERKLVEDASYAVSDGVRPAAPGTRPAAGSGKSWYYATETDEQIGPITQADLFDLVRIGKVTEATRVWSEGLADWQPLREVADLAGVLAAAGNAAIGDLRMPANVSGRQRQFSQDGLRALLMTRPWVFLLSIVSWLLVAGCLFLAVFSFIEAGKWQDRTYLIGGIYQSILTALFSVLAAFLMAYSNRIGNLVLDNSAAAIEHAIYAQLRVWRFIGISTAASIVVTLGIGAFLVLDLQTTFGARSKSAVADVASTLEYCNQVRRLRTAAVPSESAAAAKHFRELADTFRGLATNGVDTIAVEFVMDLSSYCDQVAASIERFDSPAVLWEAVVRGLNGDPFGAVTDLNAAQQSIVSESNRLRKRMAEVRATLTDRYGIEFPSL